MIKTYSIWILIWMAANMESQNDTLNQVNPSGKKTGYWKQFLDQNLSPVDSIESYYYGYEFYDAGHPVFRYTKNWWLKDSRLISMGTASKKGHPALLEGTFKWFGSTDSLPFSVEIYKNGYPVALYAYHYCPEHAWHANEFVDFTRQYNNTRGSFYFEDEKSGKMEKYWMRKDNDKWKKYKIQEDQPKNK